MVTAIILLLALVMAGLVGGVFLMALAGLKELDKLPGPSASTQE